MFHLLRDCPSPASGPCFLTYRTVLWAQRSNEHEPEKNVIYLTINAYEIDPKTLKFEIQSTKIVFSGTNKSGQAYALDIELHAEVDPAASRQHISTRGIEAILRKKEAQAEFWPRLLKDKRKVHWLKTDFDKVGFYGRYRRDEY